MTASNAAESIVQGTDEKNPAGTESGGSQYLTFVLSGETYGVDILRVQEIKGWTPVTRIPNTPDYMQGVLNLRGTIVPIVDMRMRFNLERIEYTPITVIIVLSIKSESGDRVIGLVVDSVSDVINVESENIKPTPDFGDGLNTEFINGLATGGERMVMLLDVDKLLSVDEIQVLSDASEETEQNADKPDD